VLRLQGKTGKAVQDLYTPEIAATKSGYNTLDPMSIMNYDALHTNVRCFPVLRVTRARGLRSCHRKKLPATLDTATGRIEHLPARMSISFVTLQHCDLLHTWRR